MNNMTYFAGTELPPRIALTAGHRGYAGVNPENIRLAEQLSRSSEGAEQIADTAALSLRNEAGVGLYNV